MTLNKEIFFLPVDLEFQNTNGFSDVHFMTVELENTTVIVVENHDGSQVRCTQLDAGDLGHLASLFVFNFHGTDFNAILASKT